MNAPTKLAAYALGLVAVFGGATGVGATLGPDGPIGSETSSDADHGGSHGGDSAGPDPAAGGLAEQETPSGGSSAEEIPGGLVIAQDGYRLALAQGDFTAGADTPLTFQILGPDGRPVTAYDRSHDKDLHLIAVRRDTTGFQHVHPQLGADGTWAVPVDLTPGDWRFFADFTPSGHGENLVLGADAAVAGDYDPQPLPEPALTAEVDGYTVTLDGRLTPGEESELTLSVSRDGQPVTDLQPYLAAYGHLVALRDGDLAYLHVHPAGEPGDGVTQPGPGITFYATAPSTGDYRLFLDFQHRDVVRTAEFTVRAGDADNQGATPGAAHADDSHGG